MTGERARAYALIFAGLNLVIVAAGLVLTREGIAPNGKLAGTDFASFWAAAQLALAGEPAAAWESGREIAVQRSLANGRDLGFAPFFYPPVFLLYLLPFGLLPYLPALIAWLLATGAACWRVIAQILPGRGWLMLATPAAFSVVGHGQNAFLTTALFGGGVLGMAQRPVLAGMCFGALIYKPQLAFLIPVLLLATRQWRVLAVAAATAGALMLLSLMAFGSESWRAFLASAPLATALVADNQIGFQKLVSTYAGLRMLGVPSGTALVAQLLMAGAMAVLVIRSRRFDSGAQGAILIAATCLAAPYMLDYDLMLLTVPMAWLLARGQAGGFLPWEKTALMAAFLLPLIARLVAGAIALPLAPPVVAALLLVLWQRADSRINA